MVERIERLTGFQQNGVSAGGVLPAPYRDVDVQRISEDLARRFLVVELDAKCENPEQRAFHEDFETSIKARRTELLGAVLTIWRWGRQASLTGESGEFNHAAMRLARYSSSQPAVLRRSRMESLPGAFLVRL